MLLETNRKSEKRNRKYTLLTTQKTQKLFLVNPFVLSINDNFVYVIGVFEIKNQNTCLNVFGS